MREGDKKWAAGGKEVGSWWAGGGHVVGRQQPTTGDPLPTSFDPSSSLTPRHPPPDNC